MKLRQIITESQEESFIKKYFDQKYIEGFNITPNGIDIEGSLYIREGVSLSELPYKINNVSGNVDLMNCGLTSFKNMPNKCQSLNVSNNPLNSLFTNTMINTNKFSANKILIEDLSGIKISSLDLLSLNNCENLKTLKGLENISIKRLKMNRCINFQDDLNKYKIETLSMDISSSPNMPLVFLIAFGYPALSFSATDNVSESEKLNKIYDKYHHKGSDVLIDLIRDLRDAGFKKAARIT